MPIAETTMIAAQVTSKRRALALDDHDTPERHGQPAEVLANDRADQGQRRGDLEAGEEERERVRDPQVPGHRDRTGRVGAHQLERGGLDLCQAPQDVDHDRKEDERRRDDTSWRAGW